MVQYCTIHCNAIWYSTLWDNVVHYGIIRYTTVQYDTTLLSVDTEIRSASWAAYQNYTHNIHHTHTTPLWTNQNSSTTHVLKRLWALDHSRAPTDSGSAEMTHTTPQKSCCAGNRLVSIGAPYFWCKHKGSQTHASTTGKELSNRGKPASMSSPWPLECLSLFCAWSALRSFYLIYFLVAFLTPFSLAKLSAHHLRRPRQRLPQWWETQLRFGRPKRQQRADQSLGRESWRLPKNAQRKLRLPFVHVWEATISRLAECGFKKILIWGSL